MKYSFLLVVSIICWSCGTASQEGGSSDTLAYKVEKFEKKSPNCIKEDSVCAVARFEYPVFEGNDGLNKQVIEELITLFHNDADSGAVRPANLQILAEKFVNDYEQTFNETKNDAQKMEGEITAIPWNTEGYTRVARQTPKLLCLHTNTYWYMGGAHPVSMEYYYNYDRKTLKKLSLDDIFEKGYDAKLLAIAEGIFRKNEQLKPEDPLNQDNGYFFENGKFLLNDNFQLTPKSIKFLYNVYEIKAYAEGVTELEIPLSEVQALMKPEWK
jgi:nitrate reductase cytochrome c-type subunit